MTEKMAWPTCKAGQQWLLLDGGGGKTWNPRAQGERDRLSRIWDPQISCTAIH